jgi:hypothetical protein
VKKSYHVIEGKGKSAERALAAFCRANGQMLLPLVELIEQARLTVPNENPVQPYRRCNSPS